MTTTARLWLLLLPLLLPSAPAAAETALPGYDPQVYCASLAARTGARGNMDLSACLEEETHSHDSLAAHWDAVPEAIRVRCLQRHAIRRSFDLLNICVDDELERLK